MIIILHPHHPHHLHLHPPMKKGGNATTEKSTIKLFENAISIRDKSIHPFTMGVQFHPERLRDSLSNKFGMMFLNAFN